MRWNKRPEGSNWGDFGPDDQLGRLNLLTPERVKAAAREIQSGLSFCLSLPLDYPGGSVLNPRRQPPQLRPTQRDGMPYMNFPLARVDRNATDVISDDQVLMSLQYSTQWDGLGHVGALFDADGDGHAERVYYNGYRPNTDIQGPADYEEQDDFDGHECGDGHSFAHALDVSVMARKGIQGRGVMIDLAHHFGRESRPVGYDDLMQVLKADDVIVEEGDIIVLHTGFADELLRMEGDPCPEKVHAMCTALDGRDEKLLEWITESGIAAIAADNYAVELFPAHPATGSAPLMPLHHHCLFKLGIPLAELWHVTELAQWLRNEKRSRFFLTAPPLRLPGAVGSPTTPIATV